MSFNAKEISVCDGKKITVIDNLFSFSEREKMNKFLLASLFRINGGDVSANVSSYSNQIFSSYSEEDLNHLVIMETEGYKKLNGKFELSLRKVKQCRVNMSASSESCDVHHDHKGLTLLYYANLRWNLNWGGHTAFISEDLSDIEYVCAYKAGRVCVFDGTIPHMVVLPNHQAIGHRLSLAIQFGEIGNQT